MAAPSPQLKKSVASVPEVPGALPLVGHAVPLLRSPLAFIRTLHRFGDVVKFRLGPRRVLMVCDPNLTRTMLVHDRVFDKGGPVFESLRDVLGNDLASCPYSQHRKQRRMIQPAFHHTRFPRYANDMTTLIDEISSSWSDGQVIDVNQEMQKLTSAVVLAAMFGSSLTDAETAQLTKDLTAVINGIFYRTMVPEIVNQLPVPGGRSNERALDRIRHVVLDTIARRRAGATPGEDLLATLLMALDVDGDGSRMSEQELIDQVLTMFGAGTETTATALSWALYLVSRHPEVEQRLVTEATTVLDGRAATWDDLIRLTYTRQILDETLRIYPPGWIVTRTVASDTELGDYLVPAGTMLAFSPYLISHLPSLYDEPERFDPDRFAADRPALPRNSWIPFGAGARKRIGEDFAVIEATLALATIAGRWRATAQPGGGHRPLLRATLRPKDLRMRLTIRADS